MEIFVKRNKSTDDGTPGKLTVPEINFSCDTLELPWRNNKRGESCIIPDTYSATPWFSPTLKVNVLRLEDKHGRKDCLVHNGNFAGDEKKGKKTQVHGCTEVGRGYAQIALPDNKEKKQFGICSSKPTLKELVEAVGEGPHTITYTWNEGCEPEDTKDLLNDTP